MNHWPPSSLAFVERNIDVVNDGALALVISIGHRTGLFEAMAGMPPPKIVGGAINLVVGEVS